MVDFYLHPDHSTERKSGGMIRKISDEDPGGNQLLKWPDLEINPLLCPENVQNRANHTLGVIRKILAGHHNGSIQGLATLGSSSEILRLTPGLEQNHKNSVETWI